MIDVFKEFCREWLAWAESGAAKAHKYFRNYDGLCSNVYDFALNHPDQSVKNYPHRLEDYMRSQFEAQGMHRHYPFGRRSYSMRARSSSQHRCPKRLGWVRAQLEDNDNESRPTKTNTGT